MWVKGSGGDVGTLTRFGIAGLYTGISYDLKEGETVVSQKNDLVSVLNDETPLNECIQQDNDRKI
jgi:rhamnose utilization protein RhaD (predicted bifunctional aldolase and dehydrogenase)